MTSISWSYDASAPLITDPLSTQTTYYATSSLASQARNALSLPKHGPAGVNENLLATRGLSSSQTTIYATDKSSLGSDVTRIYMGHPITPTNPFRKARQVTGPNVASLKRKDFLTGGIPLN